ncbi:hypothetical protein CPC16_002336 [Podila verticillata]|nr:hypothetical protein CPC16_002336 [Podila verticillata]
MSYRLPPPVAGIVQASSPSTTSVALPHYYQQTTSSILDSALVFTFIATVACLLLFSFARTRRTSIYSSRQFFVRDEHQADAFSSTLFGWITPLLFLERKLEMVLREQKSSLGAHHRSSVSEKEIGTTSNAPVSNQQHQLSDHDVTSTRKSRWESIRPSFLGRANTASYVQDGVKSNGFPINASSASETSSHRPSTFQSDINTEVARDAIVAKIGLDHYLLVRFLKMLFTLSAVIAVTALVVLIPVYSIGQSGEDLLTTGEIMEEDGAEGPRILKLGGGWFASKRVEMLQIGNVTDNERLWAAVVIVAIFSAFVFIWVWSELMEFLKLRQSFLFRSASRYSSRVVLLQHLPPGLRSVAELKQAFANADGGVEYVYPVHDVTALDKAVKRRQVVLDRLEEAEFRYMDAIARASTMVATTTLSMRSRSWFGELVDKTKAFFGLEKTNAVLGSNNIGGQGNIGGVLSSNPEDEDYVGPLKMYQLEDVPKLSLTDLSSPASGSTLSPNTPTRGITSAVSSFAGTAASLTALKWFQKPRRPRHYAGIPLLSKRQDSIRYYRGELCRLNKLIAQGYAQQVQAMEQEQQQQVPQGQRNMAQVSNQNRGLEDIGSLNNVSVTQKDSRASIKPLSSAFLLMRTRVGAKMAAGPTLVPDLDVHSRVLGISPRDIEWRVLGQTQSSATCLFKKCIILGIGFLFLVGFGLVVAAISSLAVDHGWERVLAQDAMVSAPSAIYWRQGILAPILLTIMMLGGSWILNELCQYWGQVSKTQGELLMQRYYFLYLLPRLWATLPEVTLWSVLGPLSWRKSIRNGPKRPSNDSSSKCSTTTSSASSTAASSAFEANFTPAPTQTPRQAFQIRQPPFFYLQNLYPHLVLLFLISLTLLPLAPVLFLLWIVVLLVLNICYRYLILQVVTTKSQSGGLHYIQAINLLLFPTLACPPALLTIYLLIRQAWVQASFALVLTFAVVAMRFLFATQFGKREEMMLAKVENYHSQPKVLKLHAGQGGRSNAAGAATTTTLTAVASTNDSIMDLRQTQLGGEGLQPMVEESESDNDSAGTDRLSPGRRRTRRMIKRPTTIIGQVRNSMFSSVSQASSSHRPKSVPVFDLERYEKEILGINREQDSVRDSGTLSSTRKSSSHHQLSQIQSQEDGGKELNGEASKEQQTHTSLVRSKTIATTTPTFDPTTSEVAFSDLFSEYTHSTKLADSALSKAEEEEDEKEAKYREIVIALRRASSVASQRLPEFVNSTGALDNPGRRVRVGPVAALGNRHGGPYNANNSSKDNFRASLPALSKYPSISGRAHRPQRSLGGALSNISMSPQRSGGVGGRGAPSLPMLLIHRESAVAAKEWHRIQNLYLHPVLAEARSRVIVWLPSQTEQSFMGLSRESQGAAARFLAQCKMHNPTSPSSSTKASGFSALTLTPGVDQGAIAGQQHAHTSHNICSCQLYQELLKAVADAVALADQEVRDLRIVGLTVWLDSRHVVWGQPSEEDGRLGDRVMIAGGPSSSTLVPGGGASHQTGGTLIGDGLLSWLEEEDREGGGRGEEEDEEMGMGPGAPGIVGGSMGVIMKRPIGSYGRLVGNGEEDDISRGLL